jgi:restriction system protein
MAYRCNNEDMAPPGLVPTHQKMLWPTLQAVRLLGGSGQIEEINEKVIEIEGFTEEQQSILHGGEGPRTEIEYRLAWSRTYLKWFGALENSARGVWSLTDTGRTLSEEELTRLNLEHRSARVAARRDRNQQPTRANADGRDVDEEGDAEQWKDVLLSTMLDLSPDAFERLARRLLREAGFISVTVTGQSGDGGIDGVGVYRVSLLSFPVFFQCKRYRGSVRTSAIRDFRGAMAGRGDKGLFITTGTFTADAKREATRDGAPPIDLIDGDRLCDLLKEYALGVSTEVRHVEDVRVDVAVFEDI